MIFTTLPFLVFLLLVLAVFWTMRSDRWRHPFLFFANFFFYGWWDWRFVLLLLAVVVIAYFIALRISPAAGTAAGRRWVALGCVLLVGILGYFKYTGFFADALARALEAIGGSAGWTTLNIILPVGISFYIFQAVSYLVTVYRGKVPVERSFLKLGVYLGFFPHLVAGPIIHASTFLPQLASPRLFDQRLFFEGCRKFVIGFLYKAVFADNLAGWVDPAYADPSGATNLQVLAATLGFYGQIYFDFAGYSLMAIGVANLLGYTLPDNFNHPYRATSMVDFWHRWHISLSTWLRDYVYIPLGGNRSGPLLRYRNLFLTMLIGGFWHGASWNFILWGGLHGSALAINHAWRGRFADSPFAATSFWRVISWLLVQGTVLLCWIPFRAESFADALLILQSLGTLAAGVVAGGQPIPWLLLLLPLAVDTFVVGRPNAPERGGIRCNPLAYAILLLGLLVGLLFMHVGFVPFIYFQF
jgi:alginate O-acetyltransferase complex protein AlgI